MIGQHLNYRYTLIFYQAFPTVPPDELRSSDHIFLAIGANAFQRVFNPVNVRNLAAVDIIF